MATRHFLKKFKATLAVSKRRAKGLGSWGRAGNWERQHDLLRLLFTALRAIRKQPLIASSKLSFSSFIPIISPWLFRVSCASHPYKEGGKKIIISKARMWRAAHFPRVGSGFQGSPLEFLLWIPKAAWSTWAVLHFHMREGCRIRSGQECEFPCADRDESVQPGIKTVAQG